MAIHKVLFLVSVFISSVSQIMLKTSADVQYEKRISEYLNVRVVTAYMLFFLSSFLTIIAYQKVALSTGSLLEATGYIWVAVLGRIILNEPINKMKCAGLALIFFGIVISV